MSNSSTIPPYRERVLPGLTYFASTLVVPIISFLVSLPFGEILAYLVAAATQITIIALGVVNAPVIAIDGKTLRVGKANINLGLISSAQVIEPTDAFVERGRGLSPLAYVRFQFGVKGLVKITLNDPKDPTPYWLVSTRNPQLIAKRIS